MGLADEMAAVLLWRWIAGKIEFHPEVSWDLGIDTHGVRFPKEGAVQALYTSVVRGCVRRSEYLSSTARRKPGIHSDDLSSPLSTINVPTLLCVRFSCSSVHALIWV